MKKFITPLVVIAITAVVIIGYLILKQESPVSQEITNNYVSTEQQAIYSETNNASINSKDLVSININANNIIKPVNRKLFGTNVGTLGREQWREPENFNSQELKNLFKEVSPTFINIANAQLGLAFYKESTGIRSQRLSIIEILEKMNVSDDKFGVELLEEVKNDQAYHGELPPHKNYDDVLQFFEYSKINPEISLRIPIIFLGQISFEKMSVNLDPKTGADLVHYLNDATTMELGKLRAKNGHPKPYHVKKFVLGNEFWSNYQFQDLSIEQITSQIIAFSKAMKKADPEITLGINLVDDSYPDKYYYPVAVAESKKLFEYNDKILSKVKDNIDFVTFHHYGFGVRKGEKEIPLTAEEWRYVMAQNYFGEKYDTAGKHRRIVDKYNKELKIGITEHSGPLGSLGGAIYNADYLTYLLSNDYSFATNHDSGLFAPHMYYGLIKVSEKNDVPYIKNPNFYALKLFTNYFGDFIVQTDVENSPTFETKAIKWGGGDILNWPSEENIPSIKVISTIKDTKLYVMVINRNLDNNIRANIILHGFDSTSDIKVHTLGGQTIGADNKNNPDNIKIKEFIFKTITDPFVYTFEKHSVTVFIFQKGKNQIYN